MKSLRVACLWTCWLSTIHPPAACAWSTISYLAKQIIKVLMDITTVLHWWGDDDRGFPSGISQPVKPGSTLGCKFQPSGSIRRGFGTSAHPEGFRLYLVSAAAKEKFSSENPTCSCYSRRVWRRSVGFTTGWWTTQSKQKKKKEKTTPASTN